jgi:hypothetical protein
MAWPGSRPPAGIGAEGGELLDARSGAELEYLGASRRVAGFVGKRAEQERVIRIQKFQKRWASGAEIQEEAGGRSGDCITGDVDIRDRA